MIVNLIATYPKCGNSALTFPLVLAGQLADSSYSGWDSLHKERLSHLEDHSRPFKAIKGLDTTMIKTHRIYKDHAELTTPHGIASSVIRITRNPFDCLLSAINFLRVEAKSSNSLSGIRATVDSLFPYHRLIRRWTTPSNFIKSFTIDQLAKENLLDFALESFSRNGLTIPFYYSVCGGWRSNYESWSAAGVATLDLRYEDLVPNPSRHTIEKISRFINTDEELLEKAFGLQSENVRQQKNAGNIFFNKASKRYFMNYFSPKALGIFIDYNHEALRSMGYEDLCAEVKALNA